VWAITNAGIRGYDVEIKALATIANATIAKNSADPYFLALLTSTLYQTGNYSLA
jgi:hypothetical protein